MADIVRFRSPLRYRSSLSPLPFSSTIRADSSLAGPNRFFWHTFSLDYRDVDWLVEVFSSFLDGPSPIVAKVLIKSGRSKLYPWLTRSCRAGKRGLPSPSLEREEIPNSPPSKLIEKRGDVGGEDFLEYLPKHIPWNTWTGRGNGLCVLFTTRVSSPWKERNFEVIGIVPYLLREEAVQLSDSSIFPRVRLANSDKESSLSLNLPSN